MRRGRNRNLIWLAVLLAIMGAAKAPAADPAADAIAAEKRKLQTHFLGLPVIKYTQLADIVHLRAQGGHIVCEIPVLDGKDFPWQQFRARLREFGDDDVTVITLGKNRLLRGQREAEVRTFHLSNYDFSDSAGLSTYTLTVQPDYFRVTRSTQRGQTSDAVDLVEQQGAVTRAQLVIRHADPGLPARATTYSAEDFQTLVQRHRDIVEQHVRPILHRFGQESAFAPDPLLAWQVFAEEWRGDPTLSQQVDKLLPSLGDRNFRRRDAAQEKLRQIGRPAAGVLLRLDRSHLSPEQNARIDHVLGPYEQLQPGESAELRKDVGFLLDCVYSDDLAVRTAAMTHLKRLTGVKFTFDASADAWVRAGEVQKLREKLNPQPARRS